MADPIERDGIRISSSDGVGRITLAQPKRRNPLGIDQLRAITDAVQGFDAGVSLIVIDAEGPAFSAGHDLAEVCGISEQGSAELFDACTEMMLGLRAAPQPVVAAVQGIATAAGCQLVASCDLAIAADTATFATPGVRIGLFCSTPMVPLSRAIGPKRSMQMLLTGEPIDAATAADWGLINQVVPAAELESAVVTMLASIQRWSPHTIGLGKVAFYEQLDRPEPDAYAITSPVMAANAIDDVAQEGIGAFREKRQPN
jgi:enoyl-CoA hydratase/carnithine racemase